MRQHVRAKVLVTLAVGSAMLAMSACGSSSGGGSSGGGSAASGLSGTITIDAPLSLTGPAAFAGTGEKDGMDYAINEINSTGYLGSAKLAAKYVDVQTDNNVATTAVRGMLTDSSVAIVGFTASNQSLAVAPLAQQAKMPMLVANSGGLDSLTKTGDYIYQMDISTKYYAAKMGTALKSKGITSTAILYNTDVPAIVDMYNGYTTGGTLKDAEISVVKTVTVPSTATDFTAAVTSLMASNPPAIGILTRGASGITVITQLRQAGYKGLIWSQSGIGAGAAAKAAPVTNGVIYTASSAEGSKIPSMEKFFTDFKAKTGNQAYSFQAAGDASVWAVAHALKDANCSSRACVQKGLTQVMSTGFTGALGPLTFDNRNAKGPGVVIEVEDGKEVVIE